MIPQLILDIHEEIIVDNFAGGGGASTGIELALGRHVDHAINHSFDALGMHRINHPQTVHHCEDVFDVDPEVLAEGRRIGAAWFSPDCKHFSKAKGGKPLDKKIRGLALVMIRYAKIRTRVMFMENVEEIRTWGPLLADGRPDPAHKGRTWLALLAILGGGIAAEHPDLPMILEVLAGTVTREECVEGFGYECETRELRACDYGAPTIRKRLFMVARCDGRPIVWPVATHANARTEDARQRARGERRRAPWRPIAECIDWHLPCPSIFLSKAQAKKERCRRPLAASTLRRIATGVDRYVLKAAHPFLVSLTHQGGERVEPVDEPARTLTGAHRGEKALVVPVLSRFNGDHAGRVDGALRTQDILSPLSTQDTSNRFGVAEASLAPFLTEHSNASNQRNFPADEPLRTQCAGVKGGHFATVSVNLMRHFGKSVGQGVDCPAPTVVAGGGGKTALVTGTLVHCAHGERDKNGKKRGRGCHDVCEPMPSVLASPDVAIVTGTLVGAGGRAAQSRPRGLGEPLHTATAKADTCLAAASLVKLRGDVETHGNAPALSEPLHTLSAGGKHHGISCAYLAQHNAGFNTTPGRDALEPISSITGSGSQQQVVMGTLAAYYGSEADGQAVDEPLRTISTKPRFGLAESVAVMPIMTEEQIEGARRVAAFLREYGVVFDGEFATIDGYVIVDIGMRMLTPRELFRAQGFPEAYVIDRAWVIDPATGALTEVTLTKEQQIRMCGNSVCPPVAAAIVRVNVPEMVVREAGIKVGGRQ